MSQDREYFGGLTFREVLCIARLSYFNQGKKEFYYSIPSSKKVWKIADVYEGIDYKFPIFNKHLSYRSILISSTENPQYKILAFSGSDQPFVDWGDWWMDNAGQAFNGTSPQYETARRMAENIKPNLLIGHSLGGGLASYASIHTGIQALTVNPAPLNISASGQLMKAVYDRVINFVAQGEALDVLQDLSYKAWINRDNFKMWAEFTRLSSICPKYKLTDTVPYMRRAGRDDFRASSGAGLVAKHLLENFVGFPPISKNWSPTA